MLKIYILYIFTSEISEKVQINLYNNEIISFCDILYMFIPNKKSKYIFRKYNRSSLIKDNYFFYINKFNNIISAYKLLYSLKN